MACLYGPSSSISRWVLNSIIKISTLSHTIVDLLHQTCLSLKPWPSCFLLIYLNLKNIVHADTVMSILNWTAMLVWFLACVPVHRHTRPCPHGLFPCKQCIKWKSYKSCLYTPVYTMHASLVTKLLTVCDAWPLPTCTSQKSVKSINFRSFFIFSDKISKNVSNSCHEWHDVINKCRNHGGYFLLCITWYTYVFWLSKLIWLNLL